MQPKVIRIDGVIGQGDGEISAAWFRSQLPPNGSDPIEVSFHTEGGSVFEGFAIYDAVAAYKGPKIAKVQSSAFSIGSFILTAFDEVEMSPNAYLMLHNPRVGAEGDDEELSSTAGMITKLKTNMIEAYSIRSGKSPEDIAAILKAETYMNAGDAVANGFADRIADKPVTGRPFARLDTLPHGVVSALFGVGPSGEKREPTEGNLMSTSQPVAATVQEIKAAFPKAKSDFIVRCLERSLPMASVAAVAAEEMMAENETLASKVAAMEEELAASRAQLDELAARAKALEGEGAEEEPVIEAKAEETKEEEVTARRLGARPVAQARASKPSAAVQWNQAIQAHVAAGLPKAKAVSKANKENPGLREQMLAEVNG